jgi:hypothetical protein
MLKLYCDIIYSNKLPQPLAKIVIYISGHTNTAACTNNTCPHDSAISSSNLKKLFKFPQKISKFLD